MTDPRLWMPAQTWEDPQVCLTRTWLPAFYAPGPCWLCGRTCDLRLPGTCIMWAYDSPHFFHLECGDRPDLWHFNEDVKWDMLSFNSLLFWAFPKSRSVTPPWLAP